MAYLGSLIGYHSQIKVLARIRHVEHHCLRLFGKLKDKSKIEWTEEWRALEQLPRPQARKAVVEQMMW